MSKEKEFPLINQTEGFLLARKQVAQAQRCSLPAHQASTREWYVGTVLV